MIIDVFSHIVPQGYLNYWARAGMGSHAAGVPYFELLAQPRKDWAQFMLGEARLPYMDKYGIDFQILSLSNPTYDPVTPKEAIKLARIANDGIAEIVAKHPKRFGGVATLPMLTMDEALEELDRSVKVLKLNGVQLLTNINGKPIDSPEFIPFYKKVSEYDIPILLHPRNWDYYDWVDEYLLKLTFGWPFDSTLAMSRLVFGGILEKFPNLKIITHHAGAMISFFAGRIPQAIDDESRYRLMSKDGKINISKPPIEYFKKFYNDTCLSGSVSALRCAHDFFGTDHIIFATDFPFGAEKGEFHMREAIRIVNELEISHDEKEKIFEKTAKMLFNLS